MLADTAVDLPLAWSFLLYLALAHGHRVYQPLEAIHRHGSWAVQLFSSILADQDHQEITRLDFETVTHGRQLIFAEPGGRHLGAHDGLVMPLGNDRNVQQSPALHVPNVGFQLIELV